MPFVVTCPRCSGRYSAPDHLQGQNVECPSCRHSFVAGAPAAQPAVTRPAVTRPAAATATAMETRASSPPATATEKFITACTHCRQSFSAPQSVLGQLTRCPGCGQSFKALPTKKNATASLAPAAAPQQQDWKWFEENYEPYKPPAVEKEKPRRPQITLPNLLIGEKHKPLHMASRLSRWAARVIDSSILQLLPLFLWFAAISDVSEDPDVARSELRFTLFVIGGWILICFVINIILLARNGQSMGKLILGVKIVGADGHPCFWRIIFIRILAMNALALIPIVGPVLMIVNVLMIFRENRRCLHDEFADTIVVRAR